MKYSIEIYIANVLNIKKHVYKSFDSPFRDNFSRNFHENSQKLTFLFLILGICPNNNSGVLH